MIGSFFGKPYTSTQEYVSHISHLLDMSLRITLNQKFWINLHSEKATIDL